MTDWSELTFVADVLPAYAFVFVCFFSPIMRLPAMDAFRNLIHVLKGEMSFWTLKYKPGHIPVAKTPAPEIEFKME